MDISEIKQIIKKNYNISADEIIKIKNVYKITSQSKIYCLKVIKYDFGHFLFIVSAMKHLGNNGYANVPMFIKTNQGKEFIEFFNYYAFLTPWIKAREANYDNPIDVISASGALANLHKKSKNFMLSNDMNPRIGWFKWLENYNTRINEILNFQNRIESKEIKTEFDKLYLSIIKEEILRGKKSVDDLLASDYIEKMEEEIYYRGFCHHDFAHHNVLINEREEVCIIDFDYCILDSHLHDVSSFLLRRMKNLKWSLSNAQFILDAYSSINPIKASDIPVMAAFMEFPQDYWQLGIQYYWEKQPWDEEFFIKKLEKIKEDREEKQQFIEDFMIMKYGGYNYE